MCDKCWSACKADYPDVEMPCPNRCTAVTPASVTEFVPFSTDHLSENDVQKRFEAVVAINKVFGRIYLQIVSSLCFRPRPFFSGASEELLQHLAKHVAVPIQGGEHHPNYDFVGDGEKQHMHANLMSRMTLLNLLSRHHGDMSQP